MIKLGPKLQQRLAAMNGNGRNVSGPPTIDQVTFAITAFERPACVEALVESIRRHYPAAKIIIADNGQSYAERVEVDDYLVLPYDCGISAARNMLVQQTRTPYMLLLEDDFVFTAETRIEDMLDVLQSDPEIGVVGGPCHLIGKYNGGDQDCVSSYACDFDLFRGVLRSRPATRPMRMTASGTPYQIVDMTWNFALFRRELFNDHIWDDRLRTAEHYDFFLRMKRAEQWRVAYCPTAQINHEHLSERDSPTYSARRQDVRPYQQIAMKSNGVTDCKLTKAVDLIEQPRGLPNVILLTQGRSGSSILATMLHGLGWNCPDAGDDGESRRFVEINERALRKQWDRDQAVEFLKSLPQPWLLKDPRFLQTAPYWFDLLNDYRPSLLFLTREPERVLESHQAQGWKPRLGSVENGLEACQRIYDRWPWPKHHLTFEGLRETLATFNPRRGYGHSLRQRLRALAGR